MRNLKPLLLFVLIFSTAGCSTAPHAQETEPDTSKIIPELREVGSRGFFALDGPFAEFDPHDPTVEIWTPEGDKKAPIVVYAHGGGGYQEDDRARVEIFRRNGFATISFDSFKMNGFDDWNFVARRITNGGKQDMIWNVFQGAFEYAAKNDDWDNRNIILYGGSNGGRVVLYAGSEIKNSHIRAIISEAPAGSGYTLGDYDIPTIIPFGSLDTWAGRSETDYIWTRTYPNSPVSIEDWVNARQEKGQPVQFIFYENAGHLMFAGPLEKVTRRRGDVVAFTAYLGAAEGVIEQYERDVIAFVNNNLVYDTENIAAEDHASAASYIFVAGDGVQLTEHQQDAIKKIAETTIARTRELLPGLAAKIQMTLRITERDLSVVNGASGRADRPDKIEVSLSSAYAGGLDQAIKDGLEGTLFHELHHTVRGWTIHDNQFESGIDIAAINEGLADVFAEIQTGHPHSNYPDTPDFDAWTREILALPKDANYGEWMFMLPDGREAVGYRTGGWLVKRAMKNSGMDILQLSRLPVEEIYKLAGY